MDSEATKKRKRRNIWLGATAFTLLLAGYFLYPVLDAFFDFKREGFLDETKKVEYEGTSMDNLKAQFQAIQLYVESEGAYPDASGWMDAATVYLKTADLKKGEELKKLVNPRFPTADGIYGYAFDASLSGKYPDEIENPATAPLTFESKDTKWNAWGTPVELQPEPELPGGNRTVTAEGAVARLREILHGGQ